jgi:hypothetical protein
MRNSADPTKPRTKLSVAFFKQHRNHLIVVAEVRKILTIKPNVVVQIATTYCHGRLNGKLA